MRGACVRRRLILLTLGAALMAGSAGPAAAAGDSPYASLRGYVDPASQVAAAAAAATSTNPAAARLLRKVADQPQFVWVGDWLPTAQVQEKVRAVATAAREQGRLPQVVVYAIPQRDCGGDSAGGLTAASYPAFVKEIAAGLGAGPAAVVVEPDALALMDCLSAAARSARLQLLADAVQVLSARGASVYLDAGHADWHPVAVMADRLRQAGVGNARGVSLNVAGHGSTSAQRAYAAALAGRLPGLHAVIDTSRNGRGGRKGQWCNVAGQALGAPPQRRTDPVLDALVWVKRPGESDGSCGRGEPAAGTMWVSYTVGLAKRAGW